MNSRFLTRVACFLLLVVAALAIGCKRAQPPEVNGGGPDPGSNPDGSFTTKQTPDGEPLVVTFPSKPEWAEIPGLKPPTKGFVWRGDDKQKSRAAWVWTIPADERAQYTDQELSREYVRKIAFNAYLSYGTDPRGAGKGGWQSKPFENQEAFWNAAKDAGAGLVLIVGNKAYCLRVEGSEIGHDDPECKAFFESLKVAELENRPPVTKAPEDDLRPFARDGFFHNQAGIGTHSTGIAFCLGRNAVFRTTYTHDKFFRPDDANAKLVRYRYPTFEPDGVYRLPRVSWLVGSDEKRSRLYLHISEGFNIPAKLARFDVPEQLGKGKEEVVKDLKSLAFNGSLSWLCIAPDGQHVYALNIDEKHNKRGIFRIETENMRVTGQLPINENTQSLVLSPDGKTLYTGASTGSWHKTGASSDDSTCLIQEIDVTNWKVRRTFKVRGTVSSLRCGGDGRLYLSGYWCWIRVDPTVAGEPTSQQTANNDTYKQFILSPDAKRFYAMSDGEYPYSLNVKELFDYGRFVIAPEYMTSSRARTFGPDSLEPMRGSVALIGGGIISSDGKCLFLNAGNAFWLAGAGPLPEVDPAMKWNPVRK
ncbi:MAG: hypothetical protein L0241_23835 [Planctomycetia bacterium]|nr:hypothetical protein [Planctomycetia bacterium]